MQDLLQGHLIKHQLLSWRQPGYYPSLILLPIELSGLPIMSEQYDVYFRGDIAPGHKMGEVRQRLQALFKLDDERTASLFSGRPLAIRRDLDKSSAEQYRATLLKAGALVELRSSVTGEVLGEVSAENAPAPQSPEPQSSEPQAPESIPEQAPARFESPDDVSDIFAHARASAEVEAAAETENGAQAETAAPDSDFSLAPVGADVLLPEEKVVVEAVEVDTSGLDVAPAGEDLLQDDEKRVLENLDIDLSHLSVQPLDS